MRRLLAGLLLLGGIAAASAADVQVKDPVARATAPGAEVGAVYLKIHNAGDRPERLVKASSPAAERVELHGYSTHGSMSRMHEIPDLTIAAGRTIAFEPGGLHIMLRKLRQPLKAGDSFPLTIEFERSGAVTTTVEVKEATAVIQHGGGHSH